MMGLLPAGISRQGSLAAMLAMGFFAVQSVAADELLMKDGSRLLGKVVKKEDDTLEFETAYAGVIKVKWGEVSKLTADAPVQVMLQDESTLVADEISKTEEATLLATQADVSTQSVAPGTVAYINPEPWRTGEGVKWTGLINIDVEIDRGNTDEDNFDADFETRIRRMNDRFTFLGQYEEDKTDGTTTTQKWKQGSKYDYFLSEKLYYGVLLAFEHDKFADLDLRTRFGPHVGYQFFESKELNLDTNVGLLYVDEDYNEAENDDYWSLGWQIDFDWFLVPDRVQFYHKHTGFQSFSETNNITIDSWTGFRFPIYKGIVASTEAEIDYDGGAPSDVDKTDTTYRLKLGYQW
jgi:putative salt-induced outer membrane protein YdiY